MTFPGTHERLTLRPSAPSYCAWCTLSAKSTVFRMRARSSSRVCSLSSCFGGVCPESQAAAQQHTDVKLLSRCKLFGLAEQDLHILQGLDALRNDLIIHGIFLW